MIKWDKVEAYCYLYLGISSNDLQPSENTLFMLLDLLYNSRGMSWREIAEKVTDGYVSYITLSNKAKSLGIKSRGKGGSHSKIKLLNLNESEYRNFTNVELSRKYKVCRATIVKHAKILGFPKKRAGKRPNPFPPVEIEDDGDSQESQQSPEDL